jgi:8-oxo-dGTP pyrophosphatase MutT (NUDIX family)
MQFTTAVGRLERGLAGTLPGEQAHAWLAPRPRRQWPADFPLEQIRHAAGLLLLFQHDDRAHIVLTVRGDTPRHAGQVSLPGGVVEPGETFEQAALREAQEETGLAPDGIRVVGALTPLDIPVSGFRLHPIVVTRAVRPGLRAAAGEVAHVLELDLDELTAPGQPIEEERAVGDARLIVPAFHVRTQVVWGATAMVLADFLAILGWRPPDAR